jgi:outer membrane protein assembly factor BamD
MRRAGIGIAVAIMLAACGKSLQVKNYPTPMSLYSAGVAEYNLGNWSNAITALEQVTILLPPRDTLLPRAHMMLGRAYDKKKSYLLAAATYKRLYEGFPEDSLADDALLAMADAEANTWRGPDYDRQPADRALDAYSLVERLFPNSSLIKRAQDGQARMREGLARKELNTGIFYIKRNAFDSALINLRDAALLYPGTAAAREAMIKMVEVYRHPRLKYMDDATDVCRELRTAYATDPAVVRVCAGIRTDSTS